MLGNEGKVRKKFLGFLTGISASDFLYFELKYELLSL